MFHSVLEGGAGLFCGHLGADAAAVPAGLPSETLPECSSKRGALSFMSRIMTRSGMLNSARVPSAYFATPVNYKESRNTLESTTIKVEHWNGTAKESIYTLK